MQFDTQRPPIAELLFRLKYRNEQNAAVDIIETCARFLLPASQGFDLIVPVPPSTPRASQPVVLLATGIGKELKIPVASCIVATRPTAQLKSVTDPDERKRILEGLYAVDDIQTSRKNILLFDDLFRSGATMNAITKILLDAGKANTVSVLTITKTRRNQ
ncbi:ComF family protein [Luteolibacter sp. Populi]|uniref:ComF family protein n=1 Tax=Luteolibacter sp. Populi TaxID=3230487 RepID=UPI00346591F2